MCFYKSYDWWTRVITQYTISLQIIIFKSQNTVKSPAEYIQVPGFILTYSVLDTDFSPQKMYCIKGVIWRC